MPVPYQIIPEGSLLRPKVVTYINDNTEVVNDYATGGGIVTSALCVFASPKGRDRQIITIENGLSEFMDEFGLGPFAVYGQPLLNAYAACRAATTSNAMVHCLRVTPEDAYYSTATLIAKYKVEGENMNIQFVVKPSDTNIANLDELETACVIDSVADEQGYTPVKLFTVAYRGRGVYGRNVRFRITTDRTTDKENDYKNYNFAIYRNEELLEQVENFSVTFVPDAVYAGSSIYCEDVMNDSDEGSKMMYIYVNADGFQALYDAYLTAQPDTTFTLNDFDPLLGIDKYTRLAIPNLTIETADDVVPGAGETAVDLSVSTGIALMGGSDGSITADNPDLQDNLALLYENAFNAEVDPNILSKNRYPTTFIFDANFPLNVKLAIASLAIKRTDCMAMLDFGLDISTKASVGSYFDTNFDGIIDNRVITFEPFCMKVRDPYSQKTVTVTSTYWLAGEYFTHINSWGGKHRPLAGNRFGIISGQVRNSVYPIFDEDLDGELMDELADKHCNIAKYNQNQVVVRAMQNTSQTRWTNLTEQNNVLVLLDVKRACERLCAQFEYDFSEAEDIARFNVAVSAITEQFAGSQVRSISAHFDKSDWEAERGILHLYVEMVHKDLVKTTIIEIDVNRSSTETA